MSVYVIEGCTCAGKSTLMRFMCDQDGTLQPAPEHTPPRVIEGEDMLSRQQRIFTAFMQSYCALDRSPVSYVTDYSPVGCAAFSLALYYYTGDERYKQQSDSFIRTCCDLGVHVDHYIEQPAKLICARLRSRGRDTDDVWSEQFIECLVAAYHEIFSGKSLNLPTNNKEENEQC